MPEDKTLDLILESQEKGFKENGSLLENIIEGNVKIEKAVKELGGTFDKTNPDNPDGEEHVLKIQIKQGKPGKDADEKKIEESLFKRLMEKLPTLEAIAGKIKDLLSKDPEFAQKVKGDSIQGEPGKDADPKEIVAILKEDAEFKDSVRGKEGGPGKDGSPDTAEQIIEKINSYESYQPKEGEEKKLIKPEMIADLFTRIRELIGAGIASKTYSLSEMDDVEITGSLSDGQALVYSAQAQKWIPVTLTFGALQLLYPTSGSVDDSNLVFGFADEPTLLIINGGWYPQTGGAITWTWDSGALEATLSSPVGSGGQIFGIK